VLAEPSVGNKVFCFGVGGLGQLGDGKHTSSAAPVAVQGLRQTPRITQLAVGLYHACVLYDSSGEAGAGLPIQCWGSGFGASPKPLPGSNGATALSVYVNSVCAVVNQKVVCWDAVGPTDPVSTTTLQNTVESIALGARFVCAVVRPAQSAGAVWCWRRDNDGSLVSNSSTAVNVRGLPGNVLKLVAGDEHVCALLRTTSSSSSSGQVYCWGDNRNAELGQGITNGL
jgi:hypothetical protein